MSIFCPDQDRTRVCGEAYECTPQPETRGERRAGQKGPFMDGHYLMPLCLGIHAQKFVRTLKLLIFLPTSQPRDFDLKRHLL